MNVLEMTNIEFFELGIATLLEKLGPTGVSRFLRQCEPGTGDYTIERHKWLDKIDREAGLKEIKKIQNARGWSVKSQIRIPCESSSRWRERTISKKGSKTDRYGTL